MKIPFLVKKAVKEAHHKNQGAINALNIPDNIHDLKMWVECKISGSACEVSDDEAERFISSIVESVESANSWLVECDSWLQAIIQD